MKRNKIVSDYACITESLYGGLCEISNLSRLYGSENIYVCMCELLIIIIII